MGFDYGFPILFGEFSAGVKKKSWVGALVDLDENINFGMTYMQVQPRGVSAVITEYHIPTQQHAKILKKTINASNIQLTGIIDSELENVLDAERTLEYLQQTENDTVFINIHCGTANFFMLKGAKHTINPAFSSFDAFDFIGNTEGPILGYVKSAKACTFSGSIVTDYFAFTNLVARLHDAEQVYFDLTQTLQDLPFGDYEFIARVRAKEADTVQLSVTNQQDIGEWLLNYTAPGLATKFTCMQVYDGKLYAGTDHGTIYVTADGITWAAATVTGETTIHCLEVFDSKLYAGTGTTGKVYVYDGTSWVSSTISGGTADVRALRVHNSELWAGADNELWHLIGSTWTYFMDVRVATEILRLESYSSEHLIIATDGASANSVQVLSNVDILSWTPTWDAEIAESYNNLLPGIAGIAWNGPEFYVCDEPHNKIYRLADGDPSTIASTHNGFGDSVSDIAKGCEAWSCGQEGGVGKIWLHWDLNDPTERAEFNSPDNNPSGLTCGNTGYLWSCDRVTGKIYKHQYTISPHTLTVVASYTPNYPAGEQPEGLAWDGTKLWSCTLGDDHIYSHDPVTLMIDNSWDVPTYTFPRGLEVVDNYLWGGCDVLNPSIDNVTKYERLTSLSNEECRTSVKHGSTVYLGGTTTNVFSATPTSITWLCNIAMPTTRIEGLFLLDSDMYAGTIPLGKLYKWSAGTFIEVLELTAEQGIYAGSDFDGAMYLGTQSNAPEAAGIYKNSSSGLSEEQFAVTDDYKWLRLPFTLTSVDTDNTIRFAVLKDGTAAVWTNVDVLLVVPR